MEIIRTDGHKIRLTITPTRTTLKVPSNYTQEQFDNAQFIASLVNNDIRPVDRSFRCGWAAPYKYICMDDNGCNNIVKYSWVNGKFTKILDNREQ